MRACSRGRDEQMCAGSKEHRDPPRRIDYLMSTLTPLSAELVLNKTDQGFNYSDHLAVKSTFDLDPSNEGPRCLPFTTARKPLGIFAFGRCMPCLPLSASGTKAMFKAAKQSVMGAASCVRSPEFEPGLVDAIKGSPNMFETVQQQMFQGTFHMRSCLLE